MEHNGSEAKDNQPSSNENVNWRPVSLPHGLIDEGENSAISAVTLDEEADSGNSHVYANVQINKTTADDASTLRSKRMIKIMLGLMIGFIIICAVILWYSLFYHQSYYVAWPEVFLYEKPLIGQPKVKLLRGEMVYKISDQGDYWLVMDMDGKKGFVEKTQLSETLPKYVPGATFYGCRQYYREDSPEDCLNRAQLQFDECSQSCKNDFSGECQSTCQNQHVACKAGCSRQ